MLYYLIRPFVRIALRLFLREIHFAHAENIPQGKAVILAANHPTAFIEPCIMACFQGRSIFFLARGNLFGKRLYDFLLNQVHILPVYRLGDKGYAYVRHNYSTFEACYEALGKQKMLMILAEGTTIHEKRLRPLVKGTGRIALGTMERNEDLEDVYIVPVGVNYTHADQYQSDLYINIGEPVSTRKIIQESDGNRNKGVLKLTQELRKKLLERVIHINDPKDDEGVEVLLEMVRPNTHRPTFFSISKTDEQFLKEKEIVDAINAMEKAEKAKLWENTQKYQALLDEQAIDENVFKGKTGAAEKISLILLYPLFLISNILLFPPFFIGKYIAIHKVHYREFYSSVLLSVSLGAYIVYYGLLLGIGLLLGGYYWLWMALLVSLLTVFKLYYAQYWKDYRNNKRWRDCPPDVQDEILARRKVLLAFVGNKMKYTRQILS